jgi:hypothetical protein
MNPNLARGIIDIQVFIKNMVMASDTVTTITLLKLVMFMLHFLGLEKALLIWI